MTRDLGMTSRKRSPTDALLLAVIPPLAAGLLRMLHRTCRFITLGDTTWRTASASGRPMLFATWRTASASGRPMLFATWHYAFPAVIYYFRNRQGVVMVSRSRDGEWAARVVHALGYQTVRGSSHRGGSRALRGMLKSVEEGYDAGLIADGSQGPPQVAQKGILLVARSSGAPLVPFSMAADRYWRLNSWDRTVIAKPFSRIAFAFGPPIHVARRDRDLDRLRTHLQEELDRLTRQAWHYFDGTANGT
ncbi:MAG: lysophospholipid acyltransferase family protein [Thermodesulfobacteriota bacterium]|nr:lysophospholipid acyltransferase family protein [Thermodesulfobacteriota bacterium]